MFASGMKARTVKHRPGGKEKNREPVCTLMTMVAKKHTAGRGEMEQQESQISQRELAELVKKVHKLYIQAKEMDAPVEETEMMQVIETVMSYQLLQQSYSDQQMQIQQKLTQMTLLWGVGCKWTGRWKYYLAQVLRELYGRLQNNFCLQLCIVGARLCTSAMKCVNAGGYSEETGSQMVRVGMNVVEMLRANFPLRHIQNKPHLCRKYILSTILQLIKHAVTEDKQSGQDDGLHRRTLQLCNTYLHYLDSSLSLQMLELLAELTIQQVKQQVLAMIWDSAQVHTSTAEAQVLAMVLCQHPREHSSSNIQSVRKWLSIYWQQLLNNQQICITMQHTLQTYINHNTASTILMAITASEPTTGMDNTYLKKTVSWLLGETAQWEWTVLCIEHVQRLVMVCMRCLEQRVGSECGQLAGLLLWMEEEIVKRVYFGNEHSRVYALGRKYLGVRLLVRLCRSVSAMCKDKTLMSLQQKSLLWMGSQIMADYSRCNQLWSTFMLLAAQALYELYIHQAYSRHSYITQLLHSLALFQRTHQPDNYILAHDRYHSSKYVVWMYAQGIPSTPHIITSILLPGLKLEQVQANPYTSLLFLISQLNQPNPVTIPSTGYGPYATHLMAIANILSSTQLLQDQSIQQHYLGQVGDSRWVFSLMGTSVVGLVWLLHESLGQQKEDMDMCSILMQGWSRIQVSKEGDSRSKMRNRDRKDDKSEGGEQASPIVIDEITEQAINASMESAVVSCSMCILVIVSYYALYQLIGRSCHQLHDDDSLLEAIYYLHTKLSRQPTYKISPHPVFGPLVSTMTSPLLSKLSTTLGTASSVSNLHILFNCIISQFLTSPTDPFTPAWAEVAHQLHKQARTYIDQYCNSHQIDIRQLEQERTLPVVRVGGKLRVIRKVHKQHTQQSQ